MAAQCDRRLEHCLIVFERVPAGFALREETLNALDHGLAP